MLRSADHSLEDINAKKTASQGKLYKEASHGTYWGSRDWQEQQVVMCPYQYQSTAASWRRIQAWSGFTDVASLSNITSLQLRIRWGGGVLIRLQPPPEILQHCLEIPFLQHHFGSLVQYKELIRLFGAISSQRKNCVRNSID